jgi:hypothetical protein
MKRTYPTSESIPTPKKAIKCFSQPQLQVDQILKLPENATYQEIIFFYGEKQMREELSGPAGNSIINFVISQVKPFLKEKELSINRSQFVSFLDAWLEFLKRNHHVQDKANCSFSGWLEKVGSLLTIKDNKRAWDNGVIQGFITRTNLAKLRKNITDQIQEGVTTSSPRRGRLVGGSPFPNYPSTCNALEFGVISLDLEGNLVCSMLVAGSRPPPAVAPDATYQPELMTCKEIGELLPFCKVFFVSGQADRNEKDKITKNQLGLVDDLIQRKIISHPFWIANVYRVQDELALWDDMRCSNFLPPQKQEIGRKILVKMPQGNMRLITNFKK